jgi:hypothetical protein
MVITLRKKQKMTNLVRSNFQDHPFHLVSPSPWPEGCLGNNLLWVKLPNSGDLLKLMVPNRVRKYTGGWTNYSGKVISHKILEKGMDNRGSKSTVCENTVVKEQRVYGS